MGKSRVKKNEDELVRKIRNGDRNAFAGLFRSYYSELCVFIQRYINQPATCENLIQDLFLYLWMHRNQWEPKGTVKAYLFKAAQNRAYDYLRHQKVERISLEHYKIERDIEWEECSSGQHHQETQHEQKVDYELLVAVENAVNKLPVRMKLIFSLSRDDGLSYPEIAEVLNLSVKTVETQMGRALKSLREQLADYFLE